MSKPKKDKKKKKKTKTSTTKDSKSGHHKQNHPTKKRHSHHKKSKGHHKKGHSRSKHKKLPPLPPAQEDNLGGVVLVKDRKGKKHRKTRSPVPPPQPMPAKTPPDMKEMMKAYRSVEPVPQPEQGKTNGGMAAGDAEKKADEPPKLEPLKSIEKISVEKSKEKLNEEKMKTKPSEEKFRDKMNDQPMKEPNLKTQPMLPPVLPQSNEAPMAVTPPQKPKSEIKDVVYNTPPQSPPKKAGTKGMTTEKKGSPSLTKDSNDELTKRDELNKSEKPMTKEEKQKKWKTYGEKLLDGGMEFINREFRSVRAYIPLASTRVSFDANPQDNRFEDIVCIDHTRFRLKDQDAYIHASWVNINKNRKMILTQLPLPHTASKFWQMIIESGAQAILLLATNYEMTTFNGEATFPDQQDFLHFEDRHIRVGEFRRVKVASHWSMHVLSISNGDKRRYLHMHHYSGWCHGQELKNHMDLLRIHSVFQKYKDPHVVVSLSGCGRAGTYAAFEVAHDRLHSNECDRVSVADAVQKVRNGRMHALQRATQMRSVHLALAEHILNNGFLQQMTLKQKNVWHELLSGDGNNK